MKYLMSTFLILFIAISSFAQINKEDIISAFKSGDAGALAKNFTASIDLVVNDNDDVYSKAQAEQILKKFFSGHKPANFKIVHSGESRTGVKYFIGELKTSNGDYRVTVNMKSADDSKIHQLRIE